MEHYFISGFAMFPSWATVAGRSSFFVAMVLQRRNVPLLESRILQNSSLEILRMCRRRVGVGGELHALLFQPHIKAKVPPCVPLSSSPTRDVAIGMRIQYGDKSASL